MLFEGIAQGLEQRCRAATANAAFRRSLCIRADEGNRAGKLSGQLGNQGGFAAARASNH